MSNFPANYDYTVNYQNGNLQDRTAGSPLPDFIKDIDIYNTFNSKRVNAFDYEPAIKGIPYLFFTTPNLNLIDEVVTNDSFLYYLSQFQPEVLNMLHYGSDSTFCTESPFIKILSNLAVSYSSRDAVSRTKEIGENFYGGKLTFPSTNIDSINGEEFSVTFYDIKDLPILKLFNAWYLYHNKVRHGELFPSTKTIEKDECDFTCSVYYFITEMDGETLMYWEKQTGCAPLNIPFSIFSQNDWNERDFVKFAINFSCAIHGEPLDPEILSDFNRVALGSAQPINYKDEPEEKVYFEVEENRKYESLKLHEKKFIDGNGKQSEGYYTTLDSSGNNFNINTPYEDSENGFSTPIIIASYMKPQIGKDPKIRFKLKFTNNKSQFTGDNESSITKGAGPTFSANGNKASNNTNLDINSNFSLSDGTGSNNKNTDDKNADNYRRSNINNKDLDKFIKNSNNKFEKESYSKLIDLNMQHNLNNLKESEKNMHELLEERQNDIKKINNSNPQKIENIRI